MYRFQRVLLVALVGALLAAFALRLYQVETLSLWYHETSNVFLANRPLSSLILHTTRDINPPLYYLLLHLWIGLAGQSKFAMVFFSSAWGLILLASSVGFARWLGGNQIALVTAALVTLSPLNVWYSQEVSMHVMAATFGLWTLMALWQLLRGPRVKKRWMLLWFISAVAGLYTLYTFIIPLLWEAIFLAGWFVVHPDQRWRLRSWRIGTLLAVLFWLPGLPLIVSKLQQPPFPMASGGLDLATVLQQSLMALAVGQAMDHEALWPMIVLLQLVMAGGLCLRWRQKRGAALPLLLGALLLAIVILLLSHLTAYPIRTEPYIFLFSPAFYILLAKSFFGWTRQAHIRAGQPGALVSSLILLAPLLMLSGESLQRYWNDRNYAPDDLPGAIETVQGRWSTGDVLLVNAGYIYSAVDYYFNDPVAWRGRLEEWEDVTIDRQGLVVLQAGMIGGKASLGWGSPESRYYATTEEKTTAALDKLVGKVPRIWHLRLFDSVTDPDGVIASWLEKNAVLFYDKTMPGRNKVRLQGWYLPPTANEEPDDRIQTRFFVPENETDPWITVHGVDFSASPIHGGGWVDMNIWLEGHEAMDPNLHLAVGLFDRSPARWRWTRTIEQPLGPLRSLKALDGIQRWPVRIRLPLGLPPGRYQPRLHFYRPSDGALLLGSGENMENRHQLSFSPIEVGPTPPTEAIPAIKTPMNVTFGPLKFLGYSIPDGQWQQGASIPVELVWRQTTTLEEDVRAFIISDALSADDGGVAKHFSYPPSLWRPGEIVRDLHYVTVAPDAAPKTYPLYLQVSQGATTIPWKQGVWDVGEILQIGTLTIHDRPRNREQPEIETPLNVAFGPNIQLIGATLPGPHYYSGQEVPVTLHWYAKNRPQGRFKIFSHLIGPDGNLQTQRDLEPGNGAFPTNGWVRGEYVSTSFTIPLPRDVPDGTYELRVGLYDPATNKRVPPVGETVNAEARYLLLDQIEVRSP